MYVLWDGAQIPLKNGELADGYWAHWLFFLGIRSVISYMVAAFAPICGFFFIFFLRKENGFVLGPGKRKFPFTHCVYGWKTFISESNLTEESASE